MPKLKVWDSYPLGVRNNSFHQPQFDLNSSLVDFFEKVFIYVKERLFLKWYKGRKRFFPSHSIRSESVSNNFSEKVFAQKEFLLVDFSLVLRPIFWLANMLGCSVGNFWWLSVGRLCLAWLKISMANFFVGRILYCPEKWFFWQFLAISQDFVFVVHYFQLLVFFATFFSFWFLTRWFLTISLVFLHSQECKKGDFRSTPDSSHLCVPYR